MQGELRRLLTDHAPVAELIGDRVYWNVIPQDAVDPCIRLSRIGGASGHHTGGSDHLDDATVQIDVRALTERSMWEIRDAVKLRLDGYRGQVGQVLFRGIFLRDQQETTEKPGPTLYHRCRLDFEVWSGTA